MCFTLLVWTSIYVETAVATFEQLLEEFGNFFFF